MEENNKSLKKLNKLPQSNPMSDTKEIKITDLTVNDSTNSNNILNNNNKNVDENISFLLNDDNNLSLMFRNDDSIVMRSKQRTNNNIERIVDSIHEMKKTISTVNDTIMTLDEYIPKRISNSVNNDLIKIKEYKEIIDNNDIENINSNDDKENNNNNEDINSKDDEENNNNIEDINNKDDEENNNNIEGINIKDDEENNDIEDINNNNDDDENNNDINKKSNKSITLPSSTSFTNSINEEEILNNYFNYLINTPSSTNGKENSIKINKEKNSEILSMTVGQYLEKVNQDITENLKIEGEKEIQNYYQQLFSIEDLYIQYIDKIIGQLQEYPKEKKILESQTEIMKNTLNNDRKNIKMKIDVESISSPLTKLNNILSL